MAVNEELIRNLIHDNKYFLLASEDGARPEYVFAREALRYILEDLDKYAISIPEMPENFLGLYRGLFGERPRKDITPKTVITVPKSAGLEEISYGEDEEVFSIVIASKNKLDAKAVSVASSLPNVDAAFLFMPSDGKSYMEDLSKKIALPDRSNIVFFTENETTLAQKIFTVIEIADPALIEDDKLATLLYAALVYETQNFGEKTDAEVFELARRLLSLGANKELIKTSMPKASNSLNINLWGRALARTHVDERTASSWTFLTRKDFEKSGILPSDSVAENILKRITDAAPGASVSFFLWEENGGVKGIGTAADVKTASLVARALGVPVRSRGFGAGVFSNFTEAELKLREAIKSI